METFEGILQGLWQARPPGVSGSKVQRLTQIAVQNVKSVMAAEHERGDIIVLVVYALIISTCAEILVCILGVFIWIYWIASASTFDFT
ncbi:uncharacterized protein T551_02175 [Pneumocystis jirovecii RU7]|uniref:Uncharacterized protein n=1 Tax=Pneumocystis jirovecii (strain RU7) TaxID=1408657 RepID=A0A0W4ZMG1_PNEJ7|nr:uncharacterized protein T551_02175 [Pneumocystis jirovecii RU7]KTW29559.1 hypothetical protein T551_02175 [Pneumocystis jirovecii RU7]